MKKSGIKTISEVHEFYAGGGTVVELVQEFLDRIKKKDRVIQSFVRVYTQEALKKAQALDLELSSKGIQTLQKSQPLFGVPYTLKDNILVQGFPAYAQTKILEGYIAPYTSDVATFLEAAGGVLLGHGNMDELAMGSSTEYSGFGIHTKNPKDISRVPGGSSGGPAAAVAAHLSVFSIGTDTGGSVRQPASFTGICGFRPTWGLLSRYGIVATSSSLDQPGIFAHTVKDTETVLGALSQPTIHDATNRKEYYQQKPAQKSYTIGVPKEYYQGLRPDVQALFNRYIDDLREHYQVVDISLPGSQFNVAAYYLLMTVEAASNFERYDAIRYGKQEEGELFYAARGKNFGDEAMRRIMLGTFASSAGYRDQYYTTAQKVRHMITQEFCDAFSEVDIILTPVSPFPAFRFGEKLSDDPTQMYLADIMTLSPALAGNTSISIPISSVEEDGIELPVGAQFIASESQEAELFAFLKTLPQYEN